MKKKHWIIIFSVALLIVLVGAMIWDLFFQAAEEQNPYAYGMDQLRQKEAVVPDYKQTDSISIGFEKPHALVVDDSGNVYVAGLHRLDILAPDGIPKQRFSFPDTAISITLGPDNVTGLIWLGMQDHVVAMDRNGTFVSRWAASDPKSLITAIVVTEKRVYAADAGQKMVLGYDHSGRMLLKIAREDSLKGIPSLVIPSPYFDIALGRDGELWVVNPGRHLVEAFRPDGSLISMWGKAAMDVAGFCGCCNPTHVAIMPDGTFVTSEKGLERVKTYTPSGVYQDLVAGPESFVEGTTGLDLAIGPENRIFVLDPRKKMVRIYEKKEP
jgi:DNA-binding beta-propeller fold protein YncE